MIDISNLPVSLIQKRLISSSASARGLGRSNLGTLQNKYLQNLGVENNLTNRIANLRMPGIYEATPDYLDTLQARTNKNYLNALQGFSGRLANLPVDKPIGAEQNLSTEIPLSGSAEQQEVQTERKPGVNFWGNNQQDKEIAYNAWNRQYIQYGKTPIPDEINISKHPEIASIYPNAYVNPGYNLVMVNGKPVYQYLIDRYNRRNQFTLTDEEKLYFDYVWNEYGGKELAKYR